MSVSVVLEPGGCYTVLASKTINIKGDQVTACLVPYLAN